MNQAEQVLKALLEPMLRERGFKPVPSHLGFRRRTSFGFDYLSFPAFATGRGGPYVVKVGLGVRHNQVDEIVNQLGHVWGAANQKSTTTVYRGLEFFPFDAERDGRKVITSVSMDVDARSVGSSVSAMLLAEGFEFFDMYSDIRQCSDGLNEPINAKAHQLCNNFPLRAYYGVVAAALSQQERVPDLVRRYIDFAQQEGGIDNLMYEVGKNLSGIDAIGLRLEFLVEAALASAR